MTNRQTTSYTVRATLRRSYQLGSAGGVTMAVGVWLVVGVYALSGNAIALMGQRTAWAYLLVGLLFLPTALSWAELMSWVRGTGGSYRLVRAAGSSLLTFLNGLAHLLGWVALSALVADAFSWYASGLLELVFPPLPDRRLLGVLLVLFLGFANLTGYRSRRRVQTFVSGASAVIILLLAALLVPRAVGAPIAIRLENTNQLFRTIALLFAAMWAMDVTFEMQSYHRHPIRKLAAGVAVGPGIGLLLAILAARTISLNSLAAPALPLVELVRQSTLAGEIGVPIMLALGVIVTGVVGQIVSLASLRQVAALGQDGWLPVWLRKTSVRYRTPGRVVLFQSLLVMVFVALGSVEWLGYVAGMAFLWVGVGINVAALLLARHPDAEERSIRLPLGPALPAVGLGTNLLLLVNYPLAVLVLGAAWLALGFAAFWRRGQEQRQDAQRGLTVFQEEGAERPAYSVLVPIASLERDLNLLAFGEAVARQHGGCVVAVHVVTVPDQLRLDSGRRQAREQLDALDHAIGQMEHVSVPIYAVTRLSRSVAQGILDTMSEEDPDLIVMGWHARPRPGLGHILDVVVSNTLSNIAVLRGDWPEHPDGILVPVGGGPNAPLAAELAQALTARSGGQVTLLNVVRDPARQQDKDAATAFLEQQMEVLPSRERLVPRVVVADNPVQGILSEANGHDAVMLGASEESFLDQALFGQVPQEIARQTDSPVAMVRRHRGLPAFWLRKMWDSVTGALPTLEREDQLAVFQRLRRGARPSVNYFVLTTLSAVIATLGLLLNSPAVIIGAMLVAPLMTPIVATSIGISLGEVRTLRMSLESTLQGVLLGIFIAIVVTLVSPIGDVTNEILARTRPNLLDLGVALASGMAGAYAIARKEVGEALPGVAIAAALMPPICTIGIGLALVDFRITGGATLLFVTNLVAITLSAAIVFLLLGIRPPRERARRETLRRGLTTTTLSLLIISLLLGYFLISATRSDQVNFRVRQTLEAGVGEWENVDLESFTVDQGEETLVTATLRTSREVTQDDLMTLDSQLEEALGHPVHLRLYVVPIEGLDSAPP